MLEISKNLVVGSIVFLFLLIYGVVGAITSAKWLIITSLFEALLDVGIGSEPIIMLPAGIILWAIVIVFIAIPGSIGLFRLMTSQ